MTRWRTGRTLRIRLSAWYALTLFAILVAYGFGSYRLVCRSLSAALDRRLLGDIEIVETMIDRSADGTLRWLGPVHEHDSEAIDHVLWAEAWGPSGELEYRSEMPSSLAAELRAPGPEDPGPQGLTLAGGERLRYLEKLFPVGGRLVTLRVIRSEEPMRRTLGRLIRVGFLSIPFAVVLAGLGGYWMAGRALKPVGEMARRARSITAEGLDARLPVGDPHDELGQLATAFNHTLARLQNSFDRLRQFTSDVSHELRTPLTSLRSVGEVALQEDRDAERYRDTISSMLEEGQRLTQLVESLLALSRADAGRMSLNEESVDLASLAEEVVADLGVLAEEKGQSLTADPAPTGPVIGDAQVLRVAITNLVDNAIRHCPEGATIRVAVRDGPDIGVIEVSDDGPGIPEAHRERVFERFYRVDASRSRSRGGAGLGLAIAQWAIEAHGGTIEIDPGRSSGCTVQVVLPGLDPGRKSLRRLQARRDTVSASSEASTGPARP